MGIFDCFEKAIDFIADVPEKTVDAAAGAVDAVAEAPDKGMELLEKAFDKAIDSKHDRPGKR
jgi:hypothetical protein